MKCPLNSLQYKSSPCKKVCVTGWMVLLPDDPSRLNIFQLSNPDKGRPVCVGLRCFYLRVHTETCTLTGDVYKFQTGSRFSAIIWHKKLEEACRGSRPKVGAPSPLSVPPLAPSWVVMVLSALGRQGNSTSSPFSVKVHV